MIFLHFFDWESKHVILGLYETPIVKTLRLEIVINLQVLLEKYGLVKKTSLFVWRMKELEFEHNDDKFENYCKLWCFWNLKETFH